MEQLDELKLEEPLHILWCISKNSTIKQDVRLQPGSNNRNQYVLSSLLKLLEYPHCV